MSATLSNNTRRDDDTQAFTRSYPRCTGRDNHPRKRGSMNYSNRSSSELNAISAIIKVSAKTLSYGDLLPSERTVGGANTPTSLAAITPGDTHLCIYLQTRYKTKTTHSDHPTTTSKGMGQNQQNQIPTQQLIHIYHPASLGTAPVTV